MPEPTASATVTLATVGSGAVTAEQNLRAALRESMRLDPPPKPATPPPTDATKGPRQ